MLLLLFAESAGGASVEIRGFFSPRVVRVPQPITRRITLHRGQDTAEIQLGGIRTCTGKVRDREHVGPRGRSGGIVVSG